MYRFIFLFIFIPSLLSAQGSYTSNSKFRFNYKIESQRFIIDYDIFDFDDDELFQLDLTIVDNELGLLKPSTYEPKFEKELQKAGNSAKIIWYWQEDYPKLSAGNIDLKITPTKLLPGPEAALYSMAVPGWGRQKVTNSRFPWAVIGVAAYSLIGTGIYYATLGSDKSYDNYMEARTAADRTKYLDRAKGEHRMGVFLISAGTAIWVADVFSTFRKGMANKQNSAQLIAEQMSQSKYYTYSNTAVTYTNKQEFVATADVDFSIPQSSETNENTFALIIGNEDYSSFQLELNAESDVDFARHDALTFKEYAEKTLGIPNENITLLLDATLGQMKQGFERIKKLMKTHKEDASFIIYYAGHGLPDESTREPYLMPVDISGSNVSSAISLSKLFSELSEQPSNKTIFILDACFSGGARNNSLIAKGERAIKIKPKEDNLAGNLIVLSSSSGQETSGAYSDKNHGLFTYYLLKKLKETKGEVTIEELAEYLEKTVSKKSVLINNKEQTPQLRIANVLKAQTSTIKLK